MGWLGRRSTSLMNTKNIIPAVALAICVWCCSGCSSTSIKQSWKSPTLQGSQIQKIGILVVDDRGFVRQSLEARFARDLHEHGKEALEVSGLLGPDEIKE